MKYTCEIHDRFEGVVTYNIEAAGEAEAYEEAAIHAAEVGCRDVGEIVIFEADYLAREAFELAAYAHYLSQREQIVIVDDYKDASTAEELLWRRDDGTYGVLMFNAAWWGWKTALDGKAST